MVTVRPARAQDHDTIRKIVTDAFGQPDEAMLVDQLRADGDALVELVACEDDQPLGHILFSPVPLIGPDDTLSGAAMAPVSVTPNRQRDGIGGLLIRAGLESCAALACPAVVVLGHPEYYPRFGFRAALARNLAAPFSGASFMALELRAGALGEPRRVRYAAAFGI